MEEMVPVDKLHWAEADILVSLEMISGNENGGLWDSYAQEA